jgi:hypothetical protein
MAIPKALMPLLPSSIVHYPEYYLTYYARQGDKRCHHDDKAEATTAVDDADKASAIVEVNPEVRAIEVI